MPRQLDSQVIASTPPQAHQVEQFKTAGAGWLLFGEP